MPNDRRRVLCEVSVMENGFPNRRRRAPPNSHPGDIVMKTQRKSVNQRRNVKSRDAFSHDETAELIDRFGWKLCGVCGDHDHFPFIYSVGNYELGLPELLAIDCVNGHVLNSLCEIMRQQNGPFRDGELIRIGILQVSA